MESSASKINDFDVAPGDEPKMNEMLVSGWDDENQGIPDEDLQYIKKNNDKYIMWAAENGKLNIVKQLVENNSSLLMTRDRDGYTPLHRASYNNHSHVVEYLLNVGADYTATTNDGWTALHSAAHWNSTLCASRLIERGADVNSITNGGNTPLHFAAAHGASKDTIELLLLHPLINPSVKNQAGDTPKNIAARSGVYGPLFDMWDPCVSQLKEDQD